MQTCICLGGRDVAVRRSVGESFAGKSEENTESQSGSKSANVHLPPLLRKGIAKLEGKCNVFCQKVGCTDASAGNKTIGADSPLSDAIANARISRKNIGKRSDL